MKKFICFFLLVFLSSISLFSDTDQSNLPIDLTECDAYVTRGFTLDSINEIPKNKKGWIVVPANKGSRSLRVMDLFDDLPTRGLFSLGEKPREFTFIFAFELTPGNLAQNSLAINFSQIGENWEVFVNGYRLKEEIYYDKDGTLRIKRSVRDEVIELPNKFLKVGENILTVRIIGDPTLNRTGFYMKRGYKIDFYDKLRSEREEIIDYMLFGIYIFFGLYHLLLFLRRRKDSFNFYFGVAIILLSIYYVFRSAFIFDIVNNTVFIKSIELISMIYMFVLLMMFTDRILRGRLTKFTRLFFIITCFFSLLIVPFETEILLIWQLLSLVGILYIFFYDILFTLVNKVKEKYSTEGSTSYKNPLIALFTSMGASIPGNLFIGGLILTVTNVVDVYNVKIGDPTTYSKYGVFVFIMGIVFVLANRFLNVHNAMEELNVTLEQKVNERTKALREKSDELQAANEEMEAINENLTQTNHELIEAQEIAKRDMNMARQVQASFFPKNTPKDENWDLAFKFKPMAGVSGDLYDFYIKNGSLAGLSLLDVSGHGIASGLITLLARSVLFNRFMNAGKVQLNKIIEKINHDLIAEIGSVDYYLTGILLKFNGGEVEYVNAGHTDLLYRNSENGEVKSVEPQGKDFKGHFLGIEAMEEKFNMLKFQIEKNDMLLLYTDCLLEAVNKDNVEFGSERLAKAFANIPENSDAASALDSILKSFYSFIGDKPLSDDLSVVVLKKI